MLGVWWRAIAFAVRQFDGTRVFRDPNDKPNIGRTPIPSYSSLRKNSGCITIEGFVNQAKEYNGYARRTIEDTAIMLLINHTDELNNLKYKWALHLPYTDYWVDLMTYVFNWY